MRRKLFLVFACLGILALVVTACAPAATPTPEPQVEEPTEAPEEPEPTEPPEEPMEAEPYQIGVFFSVTGPASSLGVPERETAMMIAEQVSAEGGIEGPDGQMHPLEVIFDDDMTNPDEAVLITRRFIEQDQVPVIVGGTTSPASLAVIDLVTEAEVPFISNASSSAIVQPVEERFWVFKTPQTNQPVAEVQGDWMEANEITRIASLGVNNAFGADSMQSLQTVADEQDIEIVFEGTFEPGDTDFSAQLTQIAASDAQAVIVHATPGEGAPLTVQYQDFGLELPLLHNHGIGNRAFIDLAGEASDGVLFPIGKLLVAEQLPDDDPQKETLLQYIENYQEYTGGNTPSTFGGHAWDSMHMAIEALGAVGPDSAAIRDYLETEIRDWVGISGIFNITPEDHVGIAKESLVLVQIVDGDWVYVDPSEYTEVP